MCLEAVKIVYEHVSVKCNLYVPLIYFKNIKKYLVIVGNSNFDKRNFNGSERWSNTDGFFT